MCKVIMFKNMVDNNTYRSLDGETVERQCPLTGDWFPSKRDIRDVRNQSVSYVIEPQNKSALFGAEFVTVLKTVGGWLSRIFGGASHA